MFKLTLVFVLFTMVCLGPMTRIAADPPIPTPTEKKPVAEPGFLGLKVTTENERGRGIRVVKVDRNSPADQAGIKEGDLIIAINGRLMSKMTDMETVLLSSRPGTKLTFRIDRNGRDKEREVTLGVRPPRGERDFEFGRIGKSPHSRGVDPRRSPVDLRRLATRSVLGVASVDVTEYDRQRYRLPSRRGAIVTSIAAGSAAERMGLPLEAVIVAIDGRPIDGPFDLAQRISLYDPGTKIEVAYFYQGDLKRGRTVVVSALDPRQREKTAGAPSETNSSKQIDDEVQQRIESLEREMVDLRRRLMTLEQAGK